MRALFRRLRYVWRRRRFDAELASDLAFHQEMAARDGRRPLPNTLRLREEARDAWGWMWIERCGQDLRYAVRLLRRSPGFALAAVLMLAIGIGVNVAAFSFFNMMILRPLAIRDPDTVLRFHRRGQDQYATTVPYPAVAFYREHSRTLSSVFAVTDRSLTLEGETTPVDAQFVTGNFFADLGGAVTHGRAFTHAEGETLDGPPVAILDHWYWRRQFGSDESVVGKTLRLNGRPLIVIGITAPEFSGLHVDRPDVWLPIAQHPLLIPGSRLLTDASGDRDGVRMFGRLATGMTPALAEDELRSLALLLHQQSPQGVWEHERLVSQSAGYGRGTTTAVSRGSGDATDSGQRQAYTISAMVGSLAFLILAASCGNLGSLLLARGLGRTREIAIRAAVGAGSVRLVRQLFTESLLLGILGSAAGLALGSLVLRALLLLTEAPPWVDPTPDWRVVLFAIGIGPVAAILFGLAPALQVARQRHRTTATRQILIGTQVAASCVLLVIAGLLVRALDRVSFADPGFDYEHVVSISPGLDAHGYSADRARAYLSALEAELRSTPGVESTSLVLAPPLGPMSVIMGTAVGGRAIVSHFNRIEPAFFETMRIPIVRGRNLTAGESGSIVVSSSFASRAWPGEDPVGKRLSLGTDDADPSAGVTVVGIAGNARATALEDPDATEAYMLVTPSEIPASSIVVRTLAPPGTLALAVPAMAAAISSEVFPRVRPLREALARKRDAASRSALAVGVLGASALVLACLGIVGLVTYAVTQRTKEIGIRLALGAAPAHVLAVVLRQFSWPVAGGLAAGLGGAALLSQALRRELYGVSHLDPIAYGAAAALFLVAAGIAALIPAARALRIDLLRSLRQE